MKKILIVKIGAIGDVVMALPLITEIRRTHPDARITWLCGKIVAPILERIEGIDELIQVDEKRLLTESNSARIREVLRIWKIMFFRKFDMLLYFYHSPLYKILTITSIIKKTLKFGKEKQKTSMLPVPGRHHSYEYIHVFKNGCGPEKLETIYPVFRINKSNIKPYSARKNIRIVLACGGAKNPLRDDDFRRYPLTNYSKIGRLIVSRGWELILTGTESDSWVKDAFDGVAYIDLIGKQNLIEFVSFLSSVDLLVTHDSGPLHLADLAGCPVLGLFGPTMPEEKKSLQAASAYIWGGEHLSCRPCYDGKDYGSCSSNECLKSISPELVFEKLQRMLTVQ